MARIKGNVFTGNLDSSSSSLDGKVRVATKADLLDPMSWVARTASSATNFNSIAYDGMFVVVNADIDPDNNGIWILKPRPIATNGTTPTTPYLRAWVADEANWEKLGSSSGSSGSTDDLDNQWQH
jgi:hypothetical protein